MFEKLSLFRTANLIISGIGATNELGGVVKKFSSGKVLIVTDKGVVAANLLNKIKSNLENHNIEYAIFDKVEHDPSIESIKDCLDFSNKQNSDLVISVGGGSSIDVGKPVAVLSIKQEHKKIGIQSPFIIPNVAIIDPLMTISCPSGVTAATGMDAFTHAIEAYLSINNSAITDMFALEAIKIISSNIRSAVAKGENIKARISMSQGSLYAGIAFANAGTAAVHAIAMTIGGAYNIPHGVANAMLLPYVMKYNALSNLEKMANIADAMKENINSLSPREAAMKAIEAVRQLSIDVGVMHALKEFGAKKEDIPELASEAIKVTRLLRNNPRNTTAKDIETILNEIY